jgi:hypothetical protein
LLATLFFFLIVDKSYNALVESTKKNRFNLGISIVTQLDKITTLSTIRQHEEGGGIRDRFDLIIPPSNYNRFISGFGGMGDRFDSISPPDRISNISRCSQERSGKLR